MPIFFLDLASPSEEAVIVGVFFSFVIGMILIIDMWKEDSR